MDIITKTISLKTKGKCHVTDITPQVAEALSETKMKDGAVTIFVIGSTAAITTIEYEHALVKDLNDFYERIAPSDKHYAHDATWGDANGYSHIRATATGASFVVPFVKGKLTLGTWQQIIFIDFDNRARSREVILQFMGK